MSKWRVFDANCMVGRHMRLGPGGLHTAEDLLGEMDHLGIHEALVLDCLSRENHPADGNPRIVETTAAQPRLHPAWVGLPPGAPDEQPEPEALVEQMRAQKVPALFLFPDLFKFSLSDWTLDALLEPLAAARVPVFVNYKHIDRDGWPPDETDWRDVVGMCRRWPDLPVIVSEHRLRQANREIYRALEACPNLRLELSGLWLHRCVEYITEQWGAHRLIFGSNWPYLGQACTLATLTMADVSDDDKRLIAGDNLRGLTAWCEPEHPEVELAEPADEFVAFAQTGDRPAAMTFMDCHGHLGRTRNYHVPKAQLETIIGDMGRLGVEKVCVFSFTVARTDERFGNDVVAEAVQRYPDRFVGFTGLNPYRGRDDMLRELERCAAMGLRGVKLVSNAYLGYPAEGPLIDVACQWVHDHKQIILNHSWGGVEHMERIVSTYSEACFFTGHATAEYADIMRRYPNLYVCTCPVHGPRDCENLVDTIGADRLLFGSDLHDLPIAWGLGPILCARLSTDDKRLILGENLRRILKEYSLSS